MGEKSTFKVVIGGGSITGLTLANMLQLYDIDFVVLEAYEDITPQVGASIGILPHGNRIMDQLGLHQKILDLCPPLDSFHFRDHKGKVICEFRGMAQSMNERHGYPITFLDRQMVLQVLYDNIRDKSKIITKSRVHRVELTEDEVLVRTTDRTLYRGDILVGADGIHSAVRTEMWRLANKMSPGWIPSDEHQSVPCDYGCIFGISNPCEGIEPGASNSVFRKHQSYIINGGPSGRVYWFFFFKLKQRTYGEDIPTYSTEDKERLFAEHENDDITPNLKFRGILKNMITSALVPLQEYVFRQWYYRRIMTIGDAAHKVHPISGHGGNACIESAAALVNALRVTLARSRGGKPTLEEIERTFAQTQELRQARTTALEVHSHEQQRAESLDTPLHDLGAFYLLPMTDMEDVTFNFSRHMPFAEKLNNPHLNRVPRLVPYKDELLVTPRSRGVTKFYFMGLYLLVAAVVYYGMWVWSANWGLQEHLEPVLTTGNFTYDTSFSLKRRYTGWKAIDDYLAFLAAIFVPGLKNWAPHFGMLQMYFLGMLIQPFTVWTVEAYRRRNRRTPLWFPTIWFTLVQSAGIGIYMPIYYAIYTYISEGETYWWPLNREVPVQYASSMIWATSIGYVLPTILMFLPWANPNTVQNLESLWQISPMLVPLICWFLGYFYVKRHNLKRVSRTAKEVFPDMPHLKRLYLFTAALGLVFHFYALGSILISNELSLKSVFWPNFSRSSKTFGEGLRSLFMADFWGFYVATYGWLCMAVWDLKRMGRVQVNVRKASAIIALGHIIIGPGATISLVWYWREIILAKTIFP
ncbi:hypothetical protein G7054_g424 [Neopestalotiopsis clavispora]|nr:hypothetical protein G7054_g424 [Neopestalotiopsis clavispora]